MDDREVKPRRELEVRSWWGRILVGRKPARTFLRLIVIVLLTLVLTKWCFLPVRVTGRSMEPTYRNGRVSVVNLLAYYGREPRRGDVVAIQLSGRRMIILKRIVGMPGERVLVRDGRTYINGAPADEPYARGRDIPPMTREVELGPRQYLVIGDNRDISEYGIIHRAEIKGKVLF
jgi:signal peptidase I